MISFILPTYNERDNIKYMIDSIIEQVGGDIELIVVDDDSPDKTWEVVENIKDNRVRLIRRKGERGIASAIERGIKESYGEIVSWMDCDRSHPPKYLPGMIQKLNEGYSIVIASRYVKGAKDQRSFIRRVTSYSFNLYAYLVLGKIRDYDSGFVVMRKKVFDNISLLTNCYGDYFIELMYKCVKAGYRITEVPFSNPDREFGTSKTGDNPLSLLKHGINYGIRVLKLKILVR